VADGASSPGRRASGPAWHVWPGLCLSLVLLNASLTFDNVWPTPKIRFGYALSSELAVGVLLLVILHRGADGLARRVLPALWVVLVFGHYLDVTAPGLYGREFNLYWDSQHLGNVTAMLARAAPLWLLVGAAVAVALAIWAVYLAAQLAFRGVSAAVARPPARRVLAAAAVVVLGVWTAQALGLRSFATVPFADPVTAAYARQARFVLAMMGPGAVAPALGPSPDLNGPLPALRGNDVILVFVESYGAVTWDEPEMADALGSSRDDLARAVADTDRVVVSAYVESPTFGGSSWLAHLSLISGVEVRDQYAYTSLMASSRDTIITNFSRQGYRTVALMPGMRQAWPEGAFYRFDQIYGRDLLNYRGPEFGWWSIPDQYALAKIDEMERSRASRAPLFIVFPTSTTHAPFGPVAPYQPDWAQVLTDTPFDPADAERALARRPDLTNLGPSYVHAMGYEFATLAGYLRQHPGDDMVLVAIGDHQPPAAVSGRDAPWTVPVHVFGRSGAVVDHLIARGFRPGLAPQRPALGPMHELATTFLDAFAAPHGEDGSLPEAER
jgi:hypothetical protein